MSENKFVVCGKIIFSKCLNDLIVLNGYLAVEDGKITRLGSKDEYKVLEQLGSFESHRVIKLNESQLLIPGLVDCHTHAPQFPNIGSGLDRPLLEWLSEYTFPLESRYSDTEFAAKIYDTVVKRLLNNGTTTACYFGSLHLEGTIELVNSAVKHRQRALIGKVSMNLENDAGYFNKTEKELADVETFVKKVLDYKNDLVEPVITPRFAASCDEELMCGLSDISEKYKCRIQSHISENQNEIEYVLQINPTCANYTNVYEKSRILTNRCIMAHAIHLSDEEIKTLVQKGVSIAHCPASNTRLKSGLCPVRKYLEKNLTVGLGTDISGGDNASMLDAMRRAMDVSTHLELQGQNGTSLNWIEAFYLATLGGAKALNLDDKIGNFEVGKDFDALVIDVHSKQGPIDKFEHCCATTDHERALSLLQKFIYLGDDRNITQVYVKGHKVKDIPSI